MTEPFNQILGVRIRLIFQVFLTLVLNSKLCSQNLIPNPGFDSLISCPQNDSEIDLARNWSTATNGTPDLFNACSNIPGLQVPNAGTTPFSYQEPRSGQGYAGIYVFGDLIPPGNSEYIQTSLKEILLQNKTYFVEFFVSPDFVSGRSQGFSDAIGLGFSDTLIKRELSQGEHLGFKAAAERRGVIVDDTIGWTRVNGCYLAQGNERYVVIGNHVSLEETIFEFAGAASFPRANYFYIEDVGVYLFDPIPDTILLCEGESTLLNASFLDATYQWNTGRTDSSILVSNPGIYIIDAVIGDCVLSDTTIIISIPENSISNIDTLLCFEENKLTLSTEIPGEYMWSTGAQGNTLDVFSGGIYDVVVSNKCGDFQTIFSVEEESCAIQYFVPTAFSPNDDGINDVFKPDGPDLLDLKCQMTIYNRWGGEVFNSQIMESQSGWNGFVDGKEQEQGVYVYVIQVYEQGILIDRRQGEVVLMR